MIQILKSKAGKSRIISDILKHKPNSICYVYYDSSLPFDYIYINSHEYTLDNLKDIIISESEKLKNIISRDYFIIYTNNTESELQDFLQWLELFEHQINADTVIVTCK